MMIKGPSSKLSYHVMQPELKYQVGLNKSSRIAVHIYFASWCNKIVQSWKVGSLLCKDTLTNYLASEQICAENRASFAIARSRYKVQ